MKKFVVLAALVAVALVLGVTGTAVRSNDAQAKPEDVITFSPNVCMALTNVLEADCNDDGKHETAPEIAADKAACQAICYGTVATPAGLATLGKVLEADTSTADGTAETLAQCGNGINDDADGTIDDGCPIVNDPALFQDLNDLSGAQLGDTSTVAKLNGLWVLAFVTNDESVKFEADEGVWAGTGSTLLCDTLLEDQDCDALGTKGDKVVVERLIGNSVASLGDSQLVVTQAGVDVVYDYVVVGDPEDITLALVPDGTVQEGVSAADCADDPHLTPLDSSVFTDGVAEPEKNGLVATVTDDDGTELAGIFVDYSSDDTDVANLNLDTSVTWALESGTLAANLFCGDEVGTATITAEIEAEDAEVDVTVIGAPDAMALTASPASITCDGVNSSTVSAALVDSEGNKVVDGTDVRFEVVALGTALPITATTADGTGAATSKITPLSGVSAGVVVLVTVKDADDEVVLEGNIRIDCALPVAPPPPPVSPTGPTVKPPGTGDGGYLP